MQSAQLRSWVSARRLAERRDLREKYVNDSRTGSHLQDPLAAVALMGAALGWPVPENAVRRRQNELAREAWTKLRAQYLLR